MDGSGSGTIWDKPLELLEELSKTTKHFRKIGSQAEIRNGHVLNIGQIPYRLKQSARK
jgi:hypothetical protein